MNSLVRKLVVTGGLDIARIRTRVTRGIINLSGLVSHQGEDPLDPLSNRPLLDDLDSTLRAMAGCEGVKYAFDNWRREKTGVWTFTGKWIKKEKKESLKHDGPVAPAAPAAPPTPPSGEEHVQDHPAVH